MLRKRRMEQQQQQQASPPQLLHSPATSKFTSRMLTGGDNSTSHSLKVKLSSPSLLLKRRQPSNEESEEWDNNNTDASTCSASPSTLPPPPKKFGSFKLPTQSLKNFSRLLSGKTPTPSQKLLRQRSALFSHSTQSSPSPSLSPSPSPMLVSSRSASASPPKRDARKEIKVTLPSNLSELVFPTLEECAAYSALPAEDLPVSFRSLSEYKRAFTAALCREIQLSLGECVTRVCGLLSSRPATTVAAVGTSRRQGSSKVNELIAKKCGHKGMIVRAVKKAGPNLGRQFVKCPSGCFFWVDELCGGNSSSSSSSNGSGSAKASHSDVFDGISKDDEVYLKSQSVGLYLGCELSRRRTAAGRWRGGPQNASGAYVLGLPWKERSAAYARDDLWGVRLDGAGPLVFRSTFHGPTKCAEVELTPLSRRCFSAAGGGEYIPCHALHGPNLSTELSMLDNLADMSPDTAPILPFLVSPSIAASATAVSEHSEDNATVEELVQEVVAERGLNADQERVVRACIHTALDVAPSPPVVLVHGVFGSGKSSVIVAVLTLIDKLVARLRVDENGGDPAADTRVLFAAATNAAVDRVLLQLLHEGFTSFLRVGSRRKIARELLPFSLHGMGSDDDDVCELKDMLREAKTPEERASIASEIKEVAAGGLRLRRELIETVRVVGATSAACSFPVMNSCHFRVVFLDECSQMIEPLSLLSLANFGCERAVLVGDPQQLRPVLVSSLGLDSAEAGTSSRTSAKVAASAGPCEGLSRTLFSRLARCGVEPIMLRTQYRCHPAISAIASKLFYDGKLLDGVTPDDRAPLVPGLPPVVLCHTDRGKEAPDNFGSFFNDLEAHAVAALVKILCDTYSILPDQIGVIALCTQVFYFV